MKKWLISLPVPQRDHNIYYHPNGASNYWSETGDGELVADPLITDTFLLTETSPCIGAATNLNMFFTDDLNGVQRATVWDMGAYEKGTEPHRLLKILKYKN